MNDRTQTEQLRKAQVQRELAEQEGAHSAVDEQETAQHERRAEKAQYLREKLEERAASERETETER